MSANPIFDENRLALLEARAFAIAARKGADHHGFLHREAATILGERLAATKRDFKAPALFFDGPFSGIIEEALIEAKPPVEGSFQRITRPTSDHPVIDLEPESIDLAISVFDLHRSNGLPGLLFQINMALKPDGLLLAVLPATGTLNELHSALMAAELAHGEGAAIRVDPYAEIRQLGDLLQKTGFKLPVCDLETRTIRYKALSGLVADLRGAGASASMLAPGPKLNATVWKAAQHQYKNAHASEDGKLKASVNLAFLSGWKEDASQQKPLRPGSAKHSLKDFL